MTRHEQDVTMMARLFECRKAARFLFRDSYDETLKPYRDLIGVAMAREKCLPLQAVIRLARHIPESDAVPIMLLMAAAVDVIESSSPETGG